MTTPVKQTWHAVLWTGQNLGQIKQSCLQKLHLKYPYYPKQLISVNPFILTLANVTRNSQQASFQILVVSTLISFTLFV